MKAESNLTEAKLNSNFAFTDSHNRNTESKESVLAIRTQFFISASLVALSLS